MMDRLAKMATHKEIKETNDLGNQKMTNDTAFTYSDASLAVVVPFYFKYFLPIRRIQANDSQKWWLGGQAYVKTKYILHSSRFEIVKTRATLEGLDPEPS